MRNMSGLGYQQCCHYLTFRDGFNIHHIPSLKPACVGSQSQGTACSLFTMQRKWLRVPVKGRWSRTYILVMVTTPWQGERGWQASKWAGAALPDPRKYWNSDQFSNKVKPCHRGTWNYYIHSFSLVTSHFHHCIHMNGTAYGKYRTTTAILVGWKLSTLNFNSMYLII